MATEVKVILFYRCNLFFLFYFVSINETPAMGSQQNLTCRSKVVSIYNPPPLKMGALLPQILGAKNIKFLTAFVAISSLDTAYLRNETSHRQIKMLTCIYSLSPKGWATFRDPWSRNSWDPFRHCDPTYENSAFSVIVGLPTQRPPNPGQPNFARC